MKPYQYEPLKDGEIRLVTLPSRASGTVAVKIWTAKQSDGENPLYEALSYAWGSTAKLESIQVRVSEEKPTPSNALITASRRFLEKTLRNRASTRSLEVTKNLVGALEALRLPDRPRVFWIDAICINQQDLAEKGAQVARMASIYKSAARVAVWLGPSTDRLLDGLTALAQMASMIELDLKQVTMTAAPGQDPSWASPDAELPYDGATLQNITEVLSLPWFSRLWIWQEILSKPDTAVVQCGSKSLTWTELYKGAWCTFLKQNGREHFPTEIDLDRLNSITNISISGTISSFLILLQYSRGSQCSDNRDRIYSLLGLRSRSEQFHLQPDYTKPFTDVYRDATREYIKCTCQLDILEVCDLGDLPLALPSWVVDWSRPPRQNSLSAGFACLQSTGEVRFHENDSLEVAGVEVATVEMADTTKDIFLPYRISGTEFQKALLELLLLHKDVPVESIIRSLGCGQFSDTCLNESFPLPSFEDVQAFVQGTEVNPNDGNVEQARHEGAGKLVPVEVQSQSMDLFHRQGEGYTVCRTFIRTATGLVGLAPDCTEPGDRLCVILGCGTPLVLRPACDDSWLVVGTCYVHGLMFGEALLGQLPDHVRGVSCRDREGFGRAQFSNQLSRQVTPRDPRKGPLPLGWKLFAHEEQEYSEAYQNTETGEETWDDPRLTSEALRERGVAMRTFKLV